MINNSTNGAESKEKRKVWMGCMGFEPRLSASKVYALSSVPLGQLLKGVAAGWVWNGAH